MAKLKITQTRSQIGQTERHRGTLRALGLGKIGRTTERESSPEVERDAPQGSPPGESGGRVVPPEQTEADRGPQPLEPEAGAEAPRAQAHRPRAGLGQGPLLRSRDQGPEVARRLAHDAAGLRGRPDADLHAAPEAAWPVLEGRHADGPAPHAHRAGEPSRPRARFRRRRRGDPRSHGREGPDQEHTHGREGARPGGADEEARGHRPQLLGDRAREDRAGRRLRHRAPAAARGEEAPPQGRARPRGGRRAGGGDRRGRAGRRSSSPRPRRPRRSPPNRCSPG